MKRLFRERKTSVSSSSKPVVSSPAPLAPASTSTDAPIHARFSALHRARSHDASAKPVVSGPMQLASKSSRASMSRSANTSGGGGSGGGGGGGGGQQQQQRRHSRVLTKMPSKHDREQLVMQQPKVLASPPPRTASKLPPPAPNLSGIAVESHKLDLDVSAVLHPHPERRSQYSRDRDERDADSDAERRRTSLVVNPAFQFEGGRRSRIRTESSASSSSVSARSYSSPPSPQRRLVVRNADPDTDPEPLHTAESLSDIAAISSYAGLIDREIPSSTPSPFMHHLQLEGTGFALAPEKPAVASPTPPTMPLPEPVPAHASAAASSDAQSTNASRKQSSMISSPVPVQAKSPPTALLQSSPSITRKKYSPLAAFGFPVSQANATFASSSTAANSQTTERPTIDLSEHIPPAGLVSPPPHMHATSPPPPYSPVDRNSVGYDFPVPMPNNSRGNSSSSNSNSGSGAEVVNLDSNYDPVRYPSSNEATARNSQAYGGSVNGSRAGTQEYGNMSSDTPPPVPDRVVGNAGYSYDPRRQATSPDYGHTPGASSSATPMVQYTPSTRLTASRQNSTASSTQSGPVRGRPLIFQAMETTSEVHGIEPGIVGMIGKASVRAKGVEVNNEYAYHASHTSRAPVPPPPPKPQEPEPSSRRRLSKLHKQPSNSKIDPIRAMMHGMEKRHADALSRPENGPAEAHTDGRLHRKVSNTTNFLPGSQLMQTAHEGPARAHLQDTAGISDLGRYGPKPVPRDSTSAQPRRGRDGVRHLTEKQMEKLQYRASYVGDSATPYRVPGVDPRGRPSAEQHPLPRPPVEQQPLSRPPLEQQPMSRAPVDQYSMPRPSVEQHPLPRPPEGSARPVQLPPTPFSPPVTDHASRHQPPASLQTGFPFVVPPSTKLEAPVTHHYPSAAPRYESQTPSHYSNSRPADVPQSNFAAADVPPKRDPQTAPGSRHSFYAPPVDQQIPPFSPNSQLPTPPEEYNPLQPRKQSKKRREKVRSLVVDDRKMRQDTKVPHAPKEPVFYPLVRHLAEPALLENLLAYLSFYEWTKLCVLSKQVRHTLFVKGRDQVLERYLRTVGYAKWTWSPPEPLALTAQDLCDYMRGVSIPSYRYSAVANSYLQAPSTVDPRNMHELVTACRAFTRVVLRLRCQAEAEAAHNATVALYEAPSTSSLPAASRGASSGSQRTIVNGNGGQYPYRQASRADSASRSSSRMTSPASSFTHLPAHPHSRSNTMPSGQGPRYTRGSNNPNTFQSPLFRLRRAPLLQVFVPSPDGDWLSDTSVLECEAELNRAGVLHLLRAGDVVWDVAAGDEGNVGRLVWDGNYLIDLDYTYSRVGDPPRYLPSLAFPPSYFHRVIRTMGTGNPIVRIDVSPWGEQILSNVKLLQDRVRTETPQGGHHTVVRWVHRSSFTLRAPPGSKSIRLSMPQTAGMGPSPTGAWVVDPDWFGTVVVETEGTNEGQSDLFLRCRGAMMRGIGPEAEADREDRTVWRILRERSRPGEIWIRGVTAKEKLIPG